MNFTSTFTSLVVLQLEGGKKFEIRKNDNLYPWRNVRVKKENSVKCEGHVTCRRSYIKNTKFWSASVKNGRD